MSTSRRATGSSVRLPSPGEDATPFLVRCHVKTVPFRPLQDFELARPVQDEFKLYAWRSATLRDIASMLHMRDPSLSSPITLHAFRIVFFDPRRRVWSAREGGRGVTRIERSHFEDVLDDVYKETGEEDKSGLFAKTVQRTRPQMSPEASEAASGTTLADLNFMDGDILDCVIKSPSQMSNMKMRGGEGRQMQASVHPWSSGRSERMANIG